MLACQATGCFNCHKAHCRRNVFAAHGTCGLKTSNHCDRRQLRSRMVAAVHCTSNLFEDEGGSEKGLLHFANQAYQPSMQGKNGQDLHI